MSREVIMMQSNFSLKEYRKIVASFAINESRRKTNKKNSNRITHTHTQNATTMEFNQVYYVIIKTHCFKFKFPNFRLNKNASMLHAELLKEN